MKSYYGNERRRLKLAGHVACVGQRKFLAENLKEEITLEKCLHWKVMLKWILKLMWCEYEDGLGWLEVRTKHSIELSVNVQPSDF
jgi:hypothetical protein